MALIEGDKGDTTTEQTEPGGGAWTRSDGQQMGWKQDEQGWEPTPIIPASGNTIQQGSGSSSESPSSNSDNN
jgi:hypothetical protein